MLNDINFAYYKIKKWKQIIEFYKTPETNLVYNPVNETFILFETSPALEILYTFTYRNILFNF
jgi:hypothetical protein